MQELPENLKRALERKGYYKFPEPTEELFNSIPWTEEAARDIVENAHIRQLTYQVVCEVVRLIRQNPVPLKLIIMAAGLSQDRYFGWKELAAQGKEPYKWVWELWQTEMVKALAPLHQELYTGTGETNTVRMSEIKWILERGYLKKEFQEFKEDPEQSRNEGVVDKVKQVLRLPDNNRRKDR